VARLGRSFQDGRRSRLTVDRPSVALEQHVEVRDPIAAGLHLPSVQDSEQRVHARVDELIELLALGAYRDKFVRELSTGTRRVVDLACVLAQGPTVLLLDEPSSGIAQREAEALAPCCPGATAGASLLVIEHDLPLLGSISDRMIALDLDARYGGSPAEVIEHPAVVASYLGPTRAPSRHPVLRQPADGPQPTDARKEPSMSTTDETKTGVTTPPPKKATHAGCSSAAGPSPWWSCHRRRRAGVRRWCGDDDDRATPQHHHGRGRLIRSGPMTPAKADLLGEDVDFSPATPPPAASCWSRCAPPCVEPFTGDNGGETYQVSATPSDRVPPARPALDPLTAAMVEDAG
jgi:hypothetical protein